MSKQKQEWNAAEYLKRKAERLEKVAPKWHTNPETGERFLIRRVGAVAYAVVGSMPDIFSKDALNAWAEQGVELPTKDDDEENGSEDTELEKKIRESRRSIELMARVVQQACVMPKLVKGASEPGELDPAYLDDSDITFIFRVGTGQADGSQVELKGGESMKVQDLKSVSRGSRKRSGTIGRG
jgi:hypothetical protein